MKNFIICLLIIFYSYGCASNKPAQLETTLHAVNYLNPNINDQASPIVVTLYQLKSAITFEQANFFALYHNAVALLANDLLDKCEIEIRPAQTQTIQQTVSPDANFIGVVAAYRNPDSAKWRQLLPIPSRKKINLEINLNAQAVSLKLD